MIVRYGIDVLVEALTRHRKDSNFLPSAHDLNVQVAKVRGENVEAKRLVEEQQQRQERASWKRMVKEEKDADAQLYGSCAACEGTTFHMEQRNGRRVMLSTRKGSCPACEGAGLLRLDTPGAVIVGAATQGAAAGELFENVMAGAGEDDF